MEGFRYEEDYFIKDKRPDIELGCEDPRACTIYETLAAGISLKKLQKLQMFRLNIMMNTLVS